MLRGFLAGGTLLGFLTSGLLDSVIKCPNVQNVLSYGIILEMTIVLQSKRYRGAKFPAGLSCQARGLVLYGDEQG
jgi:hypothetical protein